MMSLRYQLPYICVFLFAVLIVAGPSHAKPSILPETVSNIPVITSPGKLLPEPIELVQSTNGVDQDEDKAEKKKKKRKKRKRVRRGSFHAGEK